MPRETKVLIYVAGSYKRSPFWRGLLLCKVAEPGSRLYPVRFNPSFFMVEEQEFYSQRGFAHEPKKCRPCCDREKLSR